MAGDAPSSDDAGAVADRLAILQLEAAYARTWDTRDASGWAACFTPGGAFTMGPAGDAPGAGFVGAEALEEFCRRASGRYEGIHLLCAPHLEFTRDDPGVARGWVHFQYFDRDRKTGRERQVVGVYAATYARTEDGWRMARRHEQAVISGGEFHGFPDADSMWRPDE